MRRPARSSSVQRPWGTSGAGRGGKGGVQGVAGVAGRNRDGGGDEERADLVGVGVAVRWAVWNGVLIGPQRRPRASGPRTQLTRNPRFAGTPSMRPRKFEPPRTMRSTRPSTLAAAQR